MKKSGQVPAALLVAVSTSLMAAGCGCNDDVYQVRRCVDSNGYVLPDDYCSSPIYYRSYMGHPYLGVPIFVYGGSGSFSQGGRASGFSRVPMDGATIRTSSGTTIGTASGGRISRGGFGGAGGSFGG